VHTPEDLMSAREYEELVADVYAQLARDDQARVYQDRRYRGKSGQEHQIDVAVELSALGGIQLLILIECKCWNQRVGLEEVLVLSGRLQDIGAHKGILVTKTGFQAGALRLARAKGIALVRCEAKGSFKIQLRRQNLDTPASARDVLSNLCEGSYSYHVLRDEADAEHTAFPLLVAELAAPTGAPDT
jgi:Restriction endonuclease